MLNQGVKELLMRQLQRCFDFQLFYTELVMTALNRFELIHVIYHVWQ